MRAPVSHSFIGFSIVWTWQVPKYVCVRKSQIVVVVLLYPRLMTESVSVKRFSLTFIFVLVSLWDLIRQTFQLSRKREHRDRSWACFHILLPIKGTRNILEYESLSSLYSTWEHRAPTNSCQSYLLLQSSIASSTTILTWSLK